MSFTYATVCSGVEGCSLALNAAPPTKGEWEPVFFSEVARFPSALLAHYYPSVPNLGDITKISCNNGAITNGTDIIQFCGKLDLLAGGTPCQDFSVAGKRAGGTEGSGTRSSLMWHYLRLVKELSPRTILWENVPGCLSANGGRDFSRFVSEITRFGYCVGWRILDCQYTRVDCWPMAIPQRRRRVWLVGLLDGTPPSVAKVLFEPESLFGHPPTRRQTQTRVASRTQDRTDLAVYNFELTAHNPLITAKRAGDNLVYPRGFGMKNYYEFSEEDSSAPLMRTGGVYDGGSETLVVNPVICEPDHATLHNTARTITGNHENRITDSSNIVFGFSPNQSRIGEGKNVCATLKPKEAMGVLASGGYAPSENVPYLYVRRLTPLECERLMGYPDNYTRIPYRGKPAEECPDTPRYEACGNGWAINCARWVLLGIHNYLKETL